MRLPEPMVTRIYSQSGPRAINIQVTGVSKSPLPNVNTHPLTHLEAFHAGHSINNFLILFKLAMPSQVPEEVDMKCEDDQHPRPPQRPLRLNASQASKEEIQSLVDRINAAAKALDTPETDLASNARQNLLLEAKILVASLEDPDAEVWPRAFQVNVALSVDIAGSLGVWDKLRDEEFITLSDAAKWSDATVLGMLPVLRG